MQAGYGAARAEGGDARLQRRLAGFHGNENRRSFCKDNLKLS